MKLVKYVVEKDIVETPCEHPLCDRLHKRFMQRGQNDVWFHDTKRVEWIVVDTETGNQVYNSSTKKECDSEAKYRNNKLVKVQEEEQK